MRDYNTSIVLDRTKFSAEQLEQKLRRNVERLPRHEVLYIQLNIGKEIIGKFYAAQWEFVSSDKVAFVERKIHLSTRRGRQTGKINITPRPHPCKEQVCIGN